MAFASRLLQACLVLTTVAALAGQKTPEQALQALQEGNRRFAADKSVPQPVGEGVRRTLARGQSPFAIVLCCADSRVPPEHVFNAGLGELFVVRVAGHACDPETLASIEYAVEHLNVPLCVVLGHEGCGAVATSVAQVEAEVQDHPAAPPSQAIQQLLERIEPAVRKVRTRALGGVELRNACEEEHVQQTVHECLRRSTLLRRYLQVGKFRVVGARYHLQSGEVEWLPTRALPPEPQAGLPAHVEAAPMGVPPHVALRLLQAGHRRFLGDGLPAGDLTAKRREALTHGQQPLAIVLTCADSRVAPEHVFDAGLGELFVLRVAGNAVNDDVLASIEYAASHTGASLLVVMGHTRCGAVTAAAQHPEGQELTPNMRALLGRLEPSVEKVRSSVGKGQDLVELAVRANVLRAVAESRARSAILRDLEAQGRFTMLPAVYDIASGDVTWLKDVAEPTGEATPPAAPHGESAPTPNSHGDEAHGHAAHPAATGGEPPAPDQQDHAGHAATTGHEPPAAGGADEHHDGHGPTAGDPAVAAEHAAAAPAPGDPAALAAWRDPIVVVGIAGVASLLLAALVAVGRRG